MRKTELKKPPENARRLIEAFVVWRLYEYWEKAMYCTQCGKQNNDSAKFCQECGSPLTESTDAPSTKGSQGKTETELQPGRGGTILALGIVSLFPLGPILGIPAWVMGAGDLKKMKKGLMDANQQGTTQAGMVLGAIGTIFYGLILIGILISVALGTSMSGYQSVGANRDAMIADITSLAANVYIYRIRPESMGGGGGSYVGYQIPPSLVSNENGTYEIVRTRRDEIILRGHSEQYKGNSIEATYGRDGKLQGLFRIEGKEFVRK